MKNRPPKDDRPAVSDRLVGANRLFERDVLLQEPARAARPRTSIIGDKKISAQGVVSGGTSRDKLDSPRARKEAEKNPRVGAVRTQSSAPKDPIFSQPEVGLRRERGYSKASPQGRAVKSDVSAVDDVRAKVTRKIIYRGAGFFLLLFVFAGVAYFAANPIAKIIERPLKSVAVEGAFQFLPKDRAMQLIGADIDGDFLQVDLESLKTVLESDPWVERVFLSRRWPDTLVVKITEQKPIARWDVNGFLNQRGEIIRVTEVDKLLGLPWLQGDEANAREIMMQFQDMSTLMRSRGLEIVALKCDNKKSWRLTLKNDKEIAIGREQVMEKLRRFVTVYDKFLGGVWGDVKDIDVRYSNGVAVRWIADSGMAKKYLNPEQQTPKNVTTKN
jgi:cell division protein FtsQ